MTDARLAEIAAQLFPKLHTANAAQEATARELLAEVRHLRRAALAAHPEPIGYTAVPPNQVPPFADLADAREHVTSGLLAGWQVVALIPVPEGT